MYARTRMLSVTMDVKLLHDDDIHRIKNDQLNDRVGDACDDNG
jgi:hypothetical protein